MYLTRQCFNEGGYEICMWVSRTGGGRGTNAARSLNPVYFEDIKTGVPYYYRYP